MNILTKILLLLLSTTLACNSNEDEKKKNPSGKAPATKQSSKEKDATEAVSFKFTYDDHIMGWLNHHCISCHGAKDKYDFTTYEEAARYADRFLARMKDQDNPMPPVSANDPIPKADFSKMETWVNDGAPEHNKKSGSTSSIKKDEKEFEQKDEQEDEEDVEEESEQESEKEFQFTYTKQISGWLDHHCISCHSAKDDVDLTGYENAKKYSQRILVRIESKDSPMPPADANDVIPVQDYLKIRTWLDDGAPE